MHPDEMTSRGYVLLREFRPELEAAAAFHLLGSVDRLEGFADVQVLTPKDRQAATPNTYSGNYGRDSFPLHTDLAHWATPPRYVALRCIVGMKGVATRVVNGEEICAMIGRNRLEATLVQPRRPVGTGKQLLRLLNIWQADGLERLRWDPLFLRAANAQAELVLNELRSALAACVPEEIVLDRTGDTLVIDNYRMLHGRSSAPSNSTTRAIARAYMDSMNI